MSIIFAKIAAGAHDGASADADADALPAWPMATAANTDRAMLKLRAEPLANLPKLDALLKAGPPAPLAERPDALVLVAGDMHSAYDRTAQFLAHVDRLRTENLGVPVAVLINGDTFELGNAVANAAPAPWSLRCSPHSLRGFPRS